MSGDPPPFMIWNDAIGYLLANQQPLGEPFATVLHENLWELYARDKPALWFWAHDNLQ